MSKIETYVQNAINISNDNTHGYTQVNRWGKDYDCSSLVITVVENAGIPVKSKGGATYTGNMLSAFKRCGFTDVTKRVNLATGAGLIRGDILLNRIHHTEIYIGNGRNVGAHSSETGGVTGQTGDQTGKEICTNAYYNYPWTNVLRYTEEVATAGGEKDVDTIAREVIAGKWGIGDDRKKRLTAAGYNPTEVQTRVNAILKGNNSNQLDTIAREVIAGKWGNGAARVQKLRRAGYNPTAVQKRVNELLR